MKIENVREKMKALDAFITDDITLSAEEAERRKKEQEEIQRAFDAQYDWLLMLWDWKEK